MVNERSKDLVQRACKQGKRFGIYFAWDQQSTPSAENFGLTGYFEDAELDELGGNTYLTVGTQNIAKSIFDKAKVGQGQLAYACLINQAGEIISEKEA